MNPFVYGRVVSKREFCPRPHLEAQLKSHILANQNVLIEGERRVGKTSLIFETIRKMDKCRLLYIDLLEIKDADELCRRMIKSFISMNQSENFFKSVLKSLAHFRPVVSVDPLTGMPTVSVGMDVVLPPDSIEGILDLFSKQKGDKKTIVVFDEFQDILNLTEAKTALSVLRSKIQFQKDIPYVFSGSIRNKLNEIFTHPDSPFFKSAIIMDVGDLDRDGFEKFLMKKLAVGKRSMKEKLFDTILVIAQGNPGDIQQLCGVLWDCSEEGDTIDETHIPKALKQIFAMERKGYEAHLNAISSQQMRCLVGIAQQGGKSPFSASFMKLTGINQPGSVKKAMARLIDLKLIYVVDGEYKFTNPFFKAWLIAENI
jgi:hypothetical protein